MIISSKRGVFVVIPDDFEPSTPVHVTQREGFNLITIMAAELEVKIPRRRHGNLQLGSVFKSL